MIDLLPPPNLIGAPERYSKWRSMQAEAVLAAADSPKRFIVQNAPTGFGKSLVYLCQALLTDARTVILTSTKALQSQLLADFAESGLIEIRGLNSYPCIEGTPTGRFGDVRREGFRADQGLPMMCDEAPCQAGAYCPKRALGCEYYDAYRKASTSGSKLIVTNYAYWMSIHKFGEGLGPVDMLVLDEAHNAFDELGGFVGTELRPSEIEAVMMKEDARALGPTATSTQWIKWADRWKGEVGAELEHLKSLINASNQSSTTKISHNTLRRARDLKRALHKLDTISGMVGDWVIDHVEDSHHRPYVKFDPVWPGEYAEQYLFLGVPKVVMVSATVRPKTAAMFGIKPQDVEYKEYPSTFPKAKRPIIYIPTAHMNFHSGPNEMKAICTTSDNIIGRRLDRKAIIQTVSYKRARDFYVGSRYREMMLIHSSDNTRDIIKQFKESRQPLILVSPVIDTGYDFPYEDAEYQIIIKVPFPVSVDKVMKARAARDSEYKDYVTAITLTQMVGRINRAEDDSGETFILDSDFGWWYFGGRSSNGKGQRLVPRSFAEALRSEQMLGPPLPKLKRIV